MELTFPQEDLWQLPMLCLWCLKVFFFPQFVLNAFPIVACLFKPFSYHLGEQIVLDSLNQTL